MTYALAIDVSAPAELYDAVHAEVLRRSGGRVDGLLVHLARATDRGFQVSGHGPSERPDQGVQSFAVRGLVIPQGGVAV